MKVAAPNVNVEDSAARLRLVLVRLTRSMRRNGKSVLTQSQLSALATIEEMGPIRLNALASVESIGPSVATRLASSLVELDYLRRFDDPEDKRACLVVITDAGRMLLAGIRVDRTIGLSSRMERLSHAERKTLDAALIVLEKMVRDG